MITLPIVRLHCFMFLAFLYIVVIFTASAQADSAKPRASFPVDSDRDGLEDIFESELGTSPHKTDTDGDFLSDYDEYCKYRTNPLKADSDGDGIPDSDWDERREYTYTIRAICEIRPPNQVGWMQDVYQDVRLLDRRPLVDDAQVIELILYPSASQRVYPQPYPPDATSNELLEYTKPSIAVNIAQEMRDSVAEMVKDAGSDLEAIKRILDWTRRETKYEKDLPWFGRFQFRDGKIEWFNSPGDHLAEKKYLETHFYADSMFKNRKHGACTAMATLRCAMLRAADFPTRMIQTLPLINRYEGDYEPLIDRLLKGLDSDSFQFSMRTLVCDEQTLLTRISKDPGRATDRKLALERLRQTECLSSVKIDTVDKKPGAVAEEIFQNLVA